MSLSTSDFHAVVLEASLAPSVHNTQLTRWRLQNTGHVLVLEDLGRRLLVGDPEGRDAGVSHGAAIEGFALACGVRGLATTVDLVEDQAIAGLRTVARLSLAAGTAPDPLGAAVEVRRTYRGAFLHGGGVEAIATLEDHEDVILVRSAPSIADLARLNDEASLRAYRNGAFRAELLSWMRLSPRDPRWAIDGLNAEAMEMSRFEAATAGVILRPAVFEALDVIGAAGPLTSEAAVVRSAVAIALFHRPVAEHPLDTGRRFYRFWLEIAAAGLDAAPMAVLADDTAACEASGPNTGSHPIVG